MAEILFSGGDDVPVYLDVGKIFARFFVKDFKASGETLRDFCSSENQRNLHWMLRYEPGQKPKELASFRNRWLRRAAGPIDYDVIFAFLDASKTPKGVSLLKYFEKGLHIAPLTVKWLVQQITEKFGLNRTNSEGAVRMWIEQKQSLRRRACRIVSYTRAP
jgi:hypothetical protein